MSGHISEQGQFTLFDRLVVLGIAALIATMPVSGIALQITSAITVNGAAISDYDIDERMKMLRVVGVRGDLRKQAEDALINDRIYMQEADRLSITVPEEAIRQGIEEYASRYSLTSGQLLSRLASNGVSEQSFRDFIRAGLAWRQVISARFGGEALEITDDEIDQAIGLRGIERREEHLLSELVMTFRPGNRARVLEIAQLISSTVRSSAEFADAARNLSEADSGASGGALGWMSLDTLSPSVRNVISSVPVGTATEPIVAGNAVYVFFVRDTRFSGSAERAFKLDHATLRVYGDNQQTARSKAAAITRRVNTCNDLLAEARAFPRGSFFRQTTDPDDTPRSLREPIDMLDSGETTILPSGNNAMPTAVILMLCERKSVHDPEARKQTLQALRTEKLTNLAQDLLTNLRASAIIDR